MTLPKVSLTLPKVSLTIPKVRLALPNVGVRETPVKWTLPKAGMTLPNPVAMTPNAHMALPKAKQRERTPPKARQDPTKTEPAKRGPYQMRRSRKNTPGAFSRVGADLVGSNDPTKSRRDPTKSGSSIFLQIGPYQKHVKYPYI